MFGLIQLLTPSNERKDLDGFMKAHLHCTLVEDSPRVEFTTHFRNFYDLLYIRCPHCQMRVYYNAKCKTKDDPFHIIKSFSSRVRM